MHICEVIISWPKHIMPEWDNLKKKWWCCEKNMTFLAKVWRRMRFITIRTTNMLVILSYPMFEWFQYVLQQVGNVGMLGKINVRLFNLPHFIMFHKMDDCFLTINFWSPCLNSWRLRCLILIYFKRACVYSNYVKLCNSKA